MYENMKVILYRRSRLTMYELTILKYVVRVWAISHCRTVEQCHIIRPQERDLDSF